MIEIYRRIFIIKILFFILSNLPSFEIGGRHSTTNIPLNELYTKSLYYTSAFLFYCEQSFLQKNILVFSMFNKDYYLIYIQILTDW